jgi:hypothetical protein
MATNDNRIGPARDQAGDVFDHDRFAEDHAAQDVADRAVGRLPHFLEVEFLDTGFVGRDRRAFYADAILLDRVRRIDGDLVVGRIAGFDAQIIIFQVDIEIGQYQAFADPFPDDPGHFVAIEFDDGVFHLDFCHDEAAFLWGFSFVCACAIAKFDDQSTACAAGDWPPN